LPAAAAGDGRSFDLYGSGRCVRQWDHSLLSIQQENRCSDRSSHIWRDRLSALEPDARLRRSLTSASNKSAFATPSRAHPATRRSRPFTRPREDPARSEVRCWIAIARSQATRGHAVGLLAAPGRFEAEHDLRRARFENAAGVGAPAPAAHLELAQCSRRFPLPRAVLSAELGTRAGRVAWGRH
jgi:hypothetical protein